MRIWVKLIAAAAAPLLLGGCLWGPGKFASTLAINKAGTFVLDYKGEIMLQLPNDLDGSSKPRPWNDEMVKCHKDGRVEPSNVIVTVDPSNPTEPAEEDEDSRPCTASELAKAKAEHEKREAERLESKRNESDQMAKLFGLPGSDDASNRRFATNLMKHQGWRSVTYKGKGLFEVDYHFEGRLGQDFAFPIMPDSDLLIPFVTLRPRTDGSVKVTAPALTGGKGAFGARAKMMGLPDKGNDGPVSRAEGRFTVTTDAEILTNNSEDGPVTVQGRRQLHWDVGPGSDKIPEMLVRL